MAVPALILVSIGAVLLGLMANGSQHQAMAYVFFAVAFTCAVVAARLRGREGAQAWEAAAAAIGGSCIRAPATESLNAFGRAPWHAWRQAMDVRIVRAIQGPGDPPAFWVLDLAYEPHADETDKADALTMALVPLRGELTDHLVEVPAVDGHQAVHNGRYLFAWRRALWPSPGRVVPPRGLPALLAEAHRLARDAHLPATPAARGEPFG